MRRDEFTEMRAFLEVAQERSFTRAASKLGVTRSALSHTISALEERLGLRLLSRTTRDVAPTAAGARLVESIQPHFEGIAAGLSAIGALRDQPSGQVRLVCPDDAVDLVFRPRLPAFLRDYPDITVELIVDNGFTNIVERQFCDLGAFALLSGKWKLEIMWLLNQRVYRFGELRKAIPGITQHMLTAQLRELEVDGLVSRTVFAEVPPRVEYGSRRRRAASSVPVRPIARGRKAKDG
jgi:DNA-binding HxlR family transcriptional regulator